MKRASLVWRRNYQKLYNIDKDEIIPRDIYNSLSEVQKQRISRSPLTNSDISTLINTAINLHSREIEHKKDARWWIPVIITLIGAVIGLLGVIIGALIKPVTG